MTILATVAAAVSLALLGANVPTTPGVAPTEPSHLDHDQWNMTPLTRVFVGLPHRVILDGTLAYVGLDTGVETWDILDPAQPLRLAHVDLPSPAYDLALLGTRLLVADGERGLAVIDVADAALPILIRELPLPGTQRGIAIAGGIAALATAGEGPAPVRGLTLVDVSQPDNPVALAFLPLADGALTVAIEGSVAYVGTGSLPFSPAAGLYAIDISAPAAPRVLPGGFHATGVPVNQAVVESGLAYLATGVPALGALLILDVNVLPPSQVARVDLSDAARGVALSAGTAWVAARSLGLLSYDVSNPATPLLMGSLRTGRETVAAAPRGDIALLAERASIGAGGLTIVDTPSLAPLREIQCMTYAEATAGSLLGDVVFLLQRDSLHLMDASNPVTVRSLGVWSRPRADFVALGISDRGTLAAVSEGVFVHLVDITDPAAMVERGSATVSVGAALRTRIVGNALHVVTGRGLETFDVSAPAAPVRTAILPTPGTSAAFAVAAAGAGARGLLVAGDTLYVLDLSSPLAPAIQGTMAIAGASLYGVAASASGTLAVVTGEGALLHSVDILDPTTPTLLGSLTGLTGYDVRVVGDRALVAVGEAGVRVVDLTTPAVPILAGGLDLAGTSYAVDADGAAIVISAGAGQQWIASCDTCGCVETWSALGASSLRAVKNGVDALLSWTVAPSTGLVNVHRTLDPQVLPAVAGLPASVIASVSGTTLADGAQPPIGYALCYRVLASGSCTGASHEP